MVTIVYGHPLQNGLNASVKNGLAEHLQTSDQSYELIDLYKDGFSPAMTADERKVFFECNGDSSDPLVQRYQKILKETDHLVFMFPIWFNEQPAIISGFFERTCLPGFAYAYDDQSTVPLLTHINKLTVLTTSGAPTEVIENQMGSMIENHFIKYIVHGVTGPITGSDGTEWLNLGAAENLDEHLQRVKDRF